MTKQSMLTIISTQDVISQLVVLDSQDISYSEPIRVDSPADVLDSPLNPSDIMEGLEMVKIILQTSTAAVALAAALSKLLKEQRAKATITRAHSKSDPVTVGDASSEEDVKKAISE